MATGEALNDIRHAVTKQASLGSAKLMTKVLNGGDSIRGGYVSGAFAALGPSVGTIALLSVIGATSAAVTQMDYRHGVENITDLYKKQLSAKLGKPAHELDAKDLNVLEKGDASRKIEANNVFAEEMHKKRAERAVGIVLSVASSLASFGIMAAAQAAGMFAGMPHGLPLLLAETAVGVATYNAVKAPLHWVAHKALGLDKPTTHERIAELHHNREAGKGITQEQVLAVFVSANPQLDRMIRSEYGRKFDDMSLQAKRKVVQDVNKLMPLKELASDLRSGKLDIPELAFMVEGQVSGALNGVPQEEQKQGVLGKLLAKFADVVKPQAKTEQPVEKPAGAAQPKNLLVYDNAAPARPFVQQVGRNPVDQSLTHVERHTQRQPQTGEAVTASLS